jgi:PAS domain S-box-containing protein
MNERIPSRPLRRSLVLAVVGVLALALLADRVYEYAVVLPRQIERQYAEQLQSQTYALGHDFSAMLLARDVEGLRLAVSSRATNPVIKRLLVTDESGIVIASTQPADEGQRVGAILPFFSLLDFSEAQGRNRLVARLGIDRMDIAGYAPVQLPAKSDELRASRRGVLFMQYDLRAIKMLSWVNLFSVGSLLRWAASCLLATALNHALLRSRLFAPLEHLQDVKARFGNGDNNGVRSLLSGSGELARLGDVFNVMHDRILEDRARLAGQEALYRSITDSGHSLIWLSGPDGGLHYFNKPWLEFTGRGLPEEQGSGWTASLHPDDLSACREACAEASANRTFLSLLCRLRRHDGAFRWILFEGTPRFDEKGAFLGHVGHCLDITERKQAEEELLDQQQRLEISITHRTQELVKARDAAQAASRAKTIFLANMSHEMRTPLNAIMGMTDLVRQKLGDERQRTQLKRVTDASRHLLGIIEDVIDMARLETEELQLCPGTLVLGELLGKVTDMVAVNLAAKGLRLDTAWSAALGARAFTGDGRRLAQVLLQLLDNAIKFTHQGVITLRAAVINETPEGALLRFDVEDTGIGIAEEDLARVFAVFEQVDGSLTRRHGGTGLGLALARRLAQRMGGELSVRSTVGHGSTFWFIVRLPVVEHVAARAGPHDEAPQAPAMQPERRVHSNGELDAVCDQLALLISQWNYSASTLLSEHAPLLARGLGDHYPGLVKALADFDFIGARERLETARAARAATTG